MSTSATSEATSDPAPSGTGPRTARRADRATEGDTSLGHVAAHLVRRIHQRHARLWAEEVGDVLTAPQYGVLQVVADDPGLDLTAVGARAALDRTTSGRVVDRLVAAELVERVPRADDRRHVTVSLTTVGADVLASTTPAARRANERLLASVPARDRALVHRLLAALADEPTPDAGHGGAAGVPPWQERSDDRPT